MLQFQQGEDGDDVVTVDALNSTGEAILILGANIDEELQRVQAKLEVYKTYYDDVVKEHRIRKGRADDFAKMMLSLDAKALATMGLSRYTETLNEEDFEGDDEA